MRCERTADCSAQPPRLPPSTIWTAVNSLTGPHPDHWPESVLLAPELRVRVAAFRFACSDRPLPGKRPVHPGARCVVDCDGLGAGIRQSVYSGGSVSCLADSSTFGDRLVN